MGRATAVTVVLDEATRRRRERTVASASGHVRQVLRARIVLGAADGLTNGRIDVACATSVNTVRKWRGRFALLGLPGLDDAHRPGAPDALWAPSARPDRGHSHQHAAIPGVDLVPPADRRASGGSRGLQLPGRADPERTWTSARTGSAAG